MRVTLVAVALAGMTLGAVAHAQIAYRAAAQASAAAGSAAPVFQAAGTAVSGTGAVTPAWPAHAVGDIALLFVESTGGQAATLSTPAGFAAVANSPQATGAGTAGTRLTVFWARATSTTMASPTVADPGDHVYAQILTYRGVIATGNPWDVAGGNVKAAASTTVTVTSVTTTEANTRIVQAVARDNDSTAAAFSAITNANLTGIAERSDAGTASGNGGGFGVWDGVMATAGATGNTTATVTSSINAFLTIALRPPLAPLTINVPAGTIANDVMVASITYRPCSATDGGACTTTIAPPAGWTLVSTLTDQTTGGGTGGYGNRLFVYQRVATGAEPASYTWGFGGALVHAGAAGGIISFSGVDTASSVVVQGGQTTGAGTSHAAPSINTGAVTNTMLVSSHSANSSAAWTPPGGMTERVDAAALAVPNDLGVSLEMNHQAFAGSGATGSRTASWTAPPAGDAGIAHMLALRPAVVVVTPGSFNAFETGTGAGAITGVIQTKVAGSAFGLDVVAISGGVQQAGFNDAVIVELLGNNTLGIALDAQNCPTSFTLVQTVAPNPTITGGRSTVNFAAVANSWRDVRVRIRWPTSSPTVTWCSTDNFAIRPNTLASFAVTDTDWQTAGTGRALDLLTFAATTPTHKAGRPFSVRATAVNAAGVPATTTNYAGAPTATLTACVGAACTATFGTLTLNTTFAAGQLVSDVASYNEVGSFALQLMDSSFASVDGADTTGDCTATGRYVCSATVNVGRFVPDHFAVALNTPVFAPACGPFTYIGQAFSYSTAPVITVTAQDFANNTTTLYQTAGSWWRITSGSLTGKSYTAAVGTLDVSGVPGVDPVITPAGLGTGTLTFSSGTGIFFTRSTPTAPASPYDADVSLAINVIDADGVSLATNPARFGTATAGNGITFSDGSALTTNDKQMRFGRLVIRNANGSQLVPLPVLVEAQYWSGAPMNTFITNTQDSCTSIAAANETMANYTANLSGSPTCETAMGGGGTLSSGRRTLLLAAPGSGNSGSVDVTVNLGASASGNTCTTQGGAPGSATTANLPHLQGNWTGGAYDANPTARAAFGVFRGAEEVVFVRENF